MIIIYVIMLILFLEHDRGRRHVVFAGNMVTAGNTLVTPG